MNEPAGESDSAIGLVSERN